MSGYAELGAQFAQSTDLNSNSGHPDCRKGIQWIAVDVRTEGYVPAVFEAKGSHDAKDFPGSTRPDPHGAAITKAI
jgi:hypothetical protein